MDEGLIEFKKNRQIKAFEFAADVVKQILAISVAVLTFTATFSRYAASRVPDITCLKWVLPFSWLLYFFSIILGLFSLAKLATLMEPEYKVKKLSIRGGMLSKLVVSQVFLFAFGVIFTFLSAIIVLF